MKCPACGFEHDEKVPFTDIDHCRAWAYLYALNRALPTSEQFKAMQVHGYLPMSKKMHDGSGRDIPVAHGDYGWAVDYDWREIAEKIFKNAMQPA